MTLSESSNNVSMNFKICRQLIHEDFRKVLTQQPHRKISEYLYILRYLISNNSFKFCFWFRLQAAAIPNSSFFIMILVFGSDWAVGQKERKKYYLSISFHG